MYQLDTDILSNVLKSSPSTVLIANLASVPVERQFTSTVTLGELIHGAYRLGARRRILLDQIENLVSQNLPVLPFDRAAARMYGEIRADLGRSGTPIGDADLRIGSISLSRGLTMVTGNVRHFQKIPGLSVENWLQS